ncbi:MAG: hypothetical protein ABSH16_06235 [Sedimentisphaerales bacterium]
MKENKLKIHLEYGSHGDLSQEILNEIRDIVRRHGELSEKQWRIRAGVVDLLTILEIVGIYTGTKIIDGFVEGLVGKDIFKELGNKFRKGAFELADRIRDFLVDLFENAVSKNKDRHEAFVLVEHINDFSLYVVLNNKRMSLNLIEKLPEAIALSLIVTANFENEDNQPRIIQLYPNFKTETWDYILMPTAQAFGKYIDRYFDIRDRTLKYISSPDEFIKIFNPDDKDDFKFLINPNRDSGVSRFDEL